MSEETGATVSRIAELNDEVRRHASHQCLDLLARNPHTVCLTQGVMQTLGCDVPDLLEAIRDFDDFTEENDPYGEHDFAAIIFQETKVYWKIDYLDSMQAFGSEDPSDPTKTHRVMTIYLPEEH